MTPTDARAHEREALPHEHEPDQTPRGFIPLAPRCRHCGSDAVLAVVNECPVRLRAALDAEHAAAMTLWAESERLRADLTESRRLWHVERKIIAAAQAALPEGAHPDLVVAIGEIVGEVVKGREAFTRLWAEKKAADDTALALSDFASDANAAARNAHNAAIEEAAKVIDKIVTKERRRIPTRTDLPHIASLVRSLSRPTEKP